MATMGGVTSVKQKLLIVFITCSIFWGKTSRAELDDVNGIQQKVEVEGLRAANLSEQDVLEEMVKQIRILRGIEESIVVKLHEIESERRALSHEKRTYYSTACLFSAVACYRKRREVSESTHRQLNK